MSSKFARLLTLVPVFAAVMLGVSSPSLAQTQPTVPPAARVASTPVPTGYRIGAEDVLGIVFWREAEMNGDVTVRPDGRITVPLIGEMQAEGLTPEVLRDQIQAAAGKYISAANVSVVVRQINSRKVFITGRVTTPGTYPLVGPRSVMQVIALAGGLNEYADAKNITVLRTQNGRSQTFKFNYKDVARGKKLEQNIMLEPGDTIVVP
jgi:polysaccharide export outer membrane protein